MSATFDVAMIDPPWPQRKGGLRAVRPNQSRALDYETLSVLDIFDLLDAEGLLVPTVFLWEIDKFLIEAEAEMEKRGYKRHARLIWDKGNGVAPAFTVRYSHEYLVWFYRGRMPPIETDMRGKTSTVFREPATGHSRKPECAYRMIKRLYPLARRVDVFARRAHEGWTAWGDEAALEARKGAQDA